MHTPLRLTANQKLAVTACQSAYWSREDIAQDYVANQSLRVTVLGWSFAILCFCWTMSQWQTASDHGRRSEDADFKSVCVYKLASPCPLFIAVVCISMGKARQLEFIRDAKGSNFLNRICREVGTEAWSSDVVYNYSGYPVHYRSGIR